MQSEIAKAIYPVFSYGIRLRDSLVNGDSPELQTSQKELLALLQGAGQVQKWADVNPGRSMGGDASSAAPRGNTQFLGMRYALVAWLDELFIADSPWKAEWTESILEHQLYGHRDRGWRFWDQAKMASAQPSTDALEAFYLCVMLGFRGDYIEAPEKLKAWLESAKALIDKGQDQEWKGPVDSQPQVDVSLLSGAKKMRRMFTIVGLSLLAVIPIAVLKLLWK